MGAPRRRTWFYVDRVQTDYFLYRGVESELEVSVAKANSGDIQLELIQQRNDAPSVFKDFLGAGHEGAQHVVAYWTDDFQRLYDKALSLGYKVIQEGKHRRRTGPLRLSGHRTRPRNRDRDLRHQRAQRAVLLRYPRRRGELGRHRSDPGTPISIEYPYPTDFPSTPTTDPSTTRWKTKR